MKLYTLYSENKGAGQLRSCKKADFLIKRLFCLPSKVLVLFFLYIFSAFFVAI